METLTGAVNLAGQRFEVSTEINLSQAEENALRVGFTYPTNTGENQTEATTRLFNEFPEGGAYRIFRTSSQTLPAWNSSLMLAVPDHAMIVLSAKNTSCVSELPGYLTAMPSRFHYPLVFAFHHEPDQYLTSGSGSGDPTPVSFINTWTSLITGVKDHANRNRLILCPIFTEYIARGAASGVTETQWRSTYNSLLSNEQIDAIGFDVYQTGFSTYRTPQHMWDVSLDICRDYGKKLVVGEWGIERRSNDPTGTQCAQVMTDQINYLADAPEALAVCWYYNGDDVLSNTVGVTREPEYNALQSLVTTYA